MRDTYHRNIQLGASRRRLEDAKVLHEQKRWTGAIYLGGYAIECALKALICYEAQTTNFKETFLFKKGLQGSELHNLTKLLESSDSLKRNIMLDRTNLYKNAWHTVTRLWRNDQLRYSDKQGNENDSQQFIQAVEILHRYLLDQQGEG